MATRLEFQMIYVIYFFSLISSIKTFDYSLIINEKHSMDKSIFRFPHSYELINNFQSNFNLTNDNTELILTKIIDRDYWCALNICSCDHCSLILELFSNDQQSPRFSTMNITINDINDHTCQFLDLQTNISLSESIQIGHRFSIARAIDYDSGNNGKLTFRLENHLDYFQLDVITLSSNEYALYGIVKKPLDREMKEEFRLILEGHDYGIPQPRMNRTSILIHILDENDNAPKFNQTEYSIRSLRENTPVGTELIQIIATDTDEGLNGLIHYSIINPPISTLFPFMINSRTGVVSLSAPLDYEITRSYRFLIRASDSGLPQSLFTDTWLSISIENINDSPVKILFVPNRRFQYVNQTLFIYENTQIDNLTLGYIRLFDQDSLATQLSLSLITLEKNLQQIYQIIPTNQINSYILMAKQGIFDREIQKEIHLRFIATDNSLTSIYDLNIHLIDLNDNPSEFPSNPLRFFVEELANYQMVNYFTEDYQMTIGYLNATDRDEGENALNRFELEPNTLVKIDAQTGRLYLTQPLDREQIQKIQIKARATNIAEPKWITDVQIEIDVLDVNDNIPRCVTPYHHLSLPENYPIDKPLIKILGNDPDNGINGTISYAFRTNSTWPFEINQYTGEIFSKKSFDYESEFQHFLFTIDLKDNGNPIENHHFNACQLEIHVEDVNDHSPQLSDDNQTKLFFDVHQSNTLRMIQLNFTDGDSGMNGKIKCSLLSVESNLQSNHSFFRLNSNGIVEILEEIREISLFKLRIRLEDYGSPSRQTLLEIIITFGDLSNSRYSSFEKVQFYFNGKQFQKNHFAFIFVLIISIISFLSLLFLIIICLCLRKHRQRHKTAIISRNKLLCSSSQQLTTSDSTVTSTSLEHRQLNRSAIWNEKTFLEHNSSMNSPSPESDTYKILHIPVDLQNYDKEKIDEISCDHGYHESYQTGSPSSSESDQFSSQLSIRREHTAQQLPYFVTKCKSLSEGFIIEMNVDGSDEDTREFN